MKEHLIEIQILNTNYTKLIPLIKNFTGESMGVIKKKIQNQEAVISCPYIKEPETFEKLYTTLKEMIQMGAEVKIIENARGEIIQEIDMSIVKNLIERRKGIVTDEERIMDLELESGYTEE